MPDRPLFLRADALEVGRKIVAILEPHCEQIMICGSVRREKKFVSDVEILFRPKLVEAKAHDLFDPPEPVPATDEVIQLLLDTELLVMRPSSKGTYTWGPLNKLAIHKESGLPVDLFCEPNAADWCRSVVIRTGPKELNVRLIQSAARRGILMHAYGTGFTRMKTGWVVPCADERQVFEICGVPWREPNERTK